MSRAHDKLAVYPDDQGTKRTFEDTYDEYRQRIRQSISLDFARYVDIRIDIGAALRL
ncbi:RNA polymerase, sigma-24 subunit, ECF subfamily protein [Paenibacillus vortex V453]|uniref:RNA polymerase, sigma-24 subunit, ECF subfamily protein n=1 Tax=Paenibacillus vortex V453 TaxID=715225 RepID=A0A2R9SV79_9BACL|nr:hypothetical protein [Paenibacillus vortex]EFU41254.1 RNA polymerase, sigma-24 subunit, ECF subfamily protein [Paenibacillus vortex V453]